MNLPPLTPLRRTNNPAGPLPRMNSPRHPTPTPPPLPRLMNSPRHATPPPSPLPRLMNSPRHASPDQPPPPPRLQRAVGRMRLNEHEIEEILRTNAVSEESVHQVLSDFRALSPSKRTHLSNRLMSDFIVSSHTNQLLNGRMQKSKRNRKGAFKRMTGKLRR